MASRLEGLDDELILDIFSHLRLQRKYGRDSANNYTDSEESRPNFHSLCLTSRRLFTVANHLLYSDAFTSDSRECEPVSLPQILRTIVHNPSLGAQIECFEHKIVHDDFEGSCELIYYNTCYDSFPWKTYYNSPAQLALLLRLAPLVTQVYIDVASHAATPFIEMLSFETEGQCYGQRTINHHGFGRLERITMSTLYDTSGEGEFTTSSSLPVEFIQSLPLLRHCSYNGLRYAPDERVKLSDVFLF
jgi:hypothetical protein